MAIDTLKKLLEEELKDLYDAEKQLLKALPKMVQAASSAELKAALKQHLEVTKGQVQRLDDAFGLLDLKAKTKSCEGMRGLIDEGQSAIEQDGKEIFRDVALIRAAQRVEHYEMAAYGAAREFAERLGQEEVAELLQKSLDEEEDEDRKLTEVCRNLLEEDFTEAEEMSPRGMARAGTAATPRRRAAH